jgi:phosphoribosylglycinamide formyltransferase-1
MTVHWVTPVCDGGDIIAQYRVALSPEDSAEVISEKEHVLEMKYYPLVILRVLNEIF